MTARPSFNEASEWRRRWRGVRPPVFLIGVIILIVGALLRCVGVSHRRLWYDELLSANFSGRGPLETLLTVMRFDVHPPLYYLQLSVWALLGREPLWLMANAIAWSLAAIGLLWIAAGRRFGARTGLVAAALLAVSPAALAYSDQVRMYSFISALIIWVWWSLENWRERPTRLNALAAVGASLCVVYAHTAAWVMISGCLVHAGYRLWRERGWPGGVRWLWLVAWILILGAPVLVLGLLHKVAHPLAPSIIDLLTTWRFLAAGPATGTPGFGSIQIAVAGGVGLALLTVGWTTPRLRAPILCLVLAPLALAAVISHLLRPIWLERIFVPITPFLALIFARFASEPGLASRLAPCARWVSVILLGVAWFGLGVVEQVTRVKGDGYVQAAAYVRDHARPGDDVVMNDSPAFWAFMWCFAGPDWGAPAHAHLMDPAWTRLTAKLPDWVRAWLSADALSYHVNGVEALLRSADQPAPNPAGDLFVVSVGRAAPILNGRVLVDRRDLPPLAIARWRRRPFTLPRAMGHGIKASTAGS